MVLFFVILALVFVVLLVIITNIVIVPQSKVYVIERLGSYSDTWSAAHINIADIDTVLNRLRLLCPHGNRCRQQCVKCHCTPKQCQKTCSLFHILPSEISVLCSANACFAKHILCFRSL